MMNELKTSEEVAAQLGISHAALRNWLKRNPEYRPAFRMAHVVLMWTEQEIQKVAVAREQTKRWPSKTDSQG